MTSNVVNLTEPFFLKVLTLVNQSRNVESPQLGDLQRRLKSDLQAIEHKVTTGAAGLPSVEWHNIKTMLIYWADEVLTAHIPDWQNFALEYDYFEERQRAWKFYVTGEKCTPNSSPAVSELFYLALALGFIGDIEGAFVHELGQELPGNKKDLVEARRAWARQLERQIQNDAVTKAADEPLEGDAEPVPGEGLYRAGLATFTICMLVLIISLFWWIKSQPDSSKVDKKNKATATATKTDG